MPRTYRVGSQVHASTLLQRIRLLFHAANVVLCGKGQDTVGHARVPSLQCDLVTLWVIVHLPSSFGCLLAETEAY